MFQRLQIAVDLGPGLAVANQVRPERRAMCHMRRVCLTVLLAALIAADAYAQDSTAVIAGARDGQHAAREVSTRGSFAGGVASGLLGPLGLLIALPVANRSVSAETIPRAALTSDNPEYVAAFRAAFTTEVQRRRRAAALRGDLMLSVPLVIVGSAFGG